MTIELELQNASGDNTVPQREDFETWITAALGGRAGVSLAVRIVGADEMRELNARYREQDRPTNVLSFPAELPAEVVANLDPVPLGDIVICAPVVADEAARQGKPVDHHWAHLTVHGLLHLLGHDHQADDEAQEMEALEIRCLSSLGIPDPYTP